MIEILKWAIIAPTLSITGLVAVLKMAASF